MKLIYTNETKTRLPAKLFTVILKRLPTAELSATHKDVELLLTNDRILHQLNKTYRGHNKPTDVLSFSFEDPVHLGQIVISVDRARAQARQNGQFLSDELKFLFAHGLLHLLGYDHEKPEEERMMLKKTYRLLGGLRG